MLIRAYLRASTQEQNANRTRKTLIKFVDGKCLKTASFYTENESGRKPKRPELMKLLDEASNGDVILTESIDRLTRLTGDEWQVLKTMIQSKDLHIVSVDLPTSHAIFSPQEMDATTDGTLKAVNNMLVDILATMACKTMSNAVSAQHKGLLKLKMTIYTRVALKIKNVTMV